MGKALTGTLWECVLDVNKCDTLHVCVLVHVLDMDTQTYQKRFFLRILFSTFKHFFILFAIISECILLFLI